MSGRPVEEAVLSDRMSALVLLVIELVLRLAQEGVIKLRSRLTHFMVPFIKFIIFNYIFI